jgi:hypothetical protein
MLVFGLIDNIFVMFGGRVFQQMVIWKVIDTRKPEIIVVSET